MIHLAIFSPIPALRAGLRALLSGDPEMNVLLVADRLRTTSRSQPAGSLQTVSVLSGEDGRSPEEGLLPPEVSIIVASPGGVDVSAPDPYGIAWTDLSLLLITGETEPGDLRRLNGLGLRAWGVIPPEATSEALQAAIRALAEGLNVISGEMMQATLLEALAGETGGEAETAGAVVNEETSLVEHLTERESDVLRLVAQGLTNKQIALALKISEHTVKFHVSSIYSKLGVSNRTEAVRKGARLGWIPL